MTELISPPDPLLLEAVSDLLSAIPVGQPATWPAHAWEQATEMGVTSLSLPESAGAAGGTIIDAVAVLGIAGKSGSSLPLAEAMLTAGWVLTEAGEPVVAAPVGIALPWTSEFTFDGDRLSGRAEGITWGRECETVVCFAQSSELLTPVVVNRSDLSVNPQLNLAGHPSDTILATAAPVRRLEPAEPIDLTVLRSRAQLGAIALIAGGIESLAATTHAYAATRQQFGHPIGEFQAVEQHLVTIEQQAVLVSMAARQAAQQVAVAAPSAAIAVTAAAVVAARAVTVAVRSSHQVHGAMGLTREYPLHTVVRALHSWRAAQLAGHDHARRLGQAAQAGDAETLYPLRPQITEYA